MFISKNLKNHIFFYKKNFFFTFNANSSSLCSNNHSAVENSNDGFIFRSSIYFARMSTPGNVSSLEYSFNASLHYIERLLDSYKIKIKYFFHILIACSCFS